MSSPADTTAFSEMKRVLSVQKTAFINEGEVTAEVRIERLQRAYNMIAENQHDIIDVSTSDFGNRSRH